MTGYQAEWSPERTPGTYLFSAIPPGDYTLQCLSRPLSRSQGEFVHDPKYVRVFSTPFDVNTETKKVSIRLPESFTGKPDRTSANQEE